MLPTFNAGHVPAQEKKNSAYCQHEACANFQVEHTDSSPYSLLPIPHSPSAPLLSSESPESKK